MKTTYFFCLAMALTVLTGCRIAHNAPLAQNPNRFEQPATNKSFVDQNGYFFPDGWQDSFGSHDSYPRGSAYSLVSIARTKGLDAPLREFQDSWIRDLAQDLRAKQRVFILVHGYNNNETKATENFDKIRSIIEYNPEQDHFIDFFWDGMVASGIGPAKIWFNACGYSQLAGEYGLRKILNSFSGKDVYLISHSRGASVVLSALSNPPYDPDFARDTQNFHQVTVSTQPPLAENGNRIKCLMFAPAVGLIDFRTPADLNSFREFSAQVSRIHVTVNPDDKTLKKYVRPLSSTFNATDLGWNPAVVSALKPTYPIIESSEIALNSHAFKDYIDHPSFKEIMRINGIAVH